MQVEIGANPNCQASEQYIFNELEKPRRIQGIKIEEDGREAVCDVVGVEPGGRWVPAYAVKITDSGEGFAYLIVGGAWGIRIRPDDFSDEMWDVTNERQWGEPFKIYGNIDDIIYGGDENE